MYEIFRLEHNTRIFHRRVTHNVRAVQVAAGVAQNYDCDVIIMKGSEVYFELKRDKEMPE